MPQDLLESRRAEALAVVGQIRDSLTTGWEHPVTADSFNSVCADLYIIIDDLTNVLDAVAIRQKYAAYYHQRELRRHKDEPG